MDDAPATQPKIVIIGAGPAGLTAAYELAKRNVTCTVLEADNVVGGISRTVERDGYRFDIGGHRFFTKVDEVETLWHEILPDEEFMLRPRMSRIYYKGKFYDYPLRAFNALRNLGPIEAVKCVASYAWARVRPPKDQTTFEGWVVGRFGWRLYRTFFKTYTEKVWGVDASELQADFAAQRIKNLSLLAAVINSIMPKRNQKDITSLIEEFEYPKFGPGQMWEFCRDKVEAAGSTVVINAKVVRIDRDESGATAVVATVDGEDRTFPADHVISSMPLPHLVRAAGADDPATLEAVNGLKFRDFLTVAVVLPEDAGFPDNWIYIHSPDVKVGRIQNFGSWSPFMVHDGKTCLGLEYFVFEGDDLWTAPDEELIARAGRELEILTLASASAVEQGFVVRMPKAYPTYDETYKAHVATLRRWLDTNAPNVYPVGRNGMHRYNNQDHSMYTAQLTVQNIIDGTDWDTWSVNVEEEYHETKRVRDRTDDPASGSTGTGRDAPVIPSTARKPNTPA